MIKTPISVINDFSGGQDTKTPIISMGLTKSPNMRNFHCSGIGSRLMKRGGYAKINTSTVESDNLDAYYPPGYQTTDYALRDTATRTKISMGFKANTSSSVTKIRLWLKKTGVPAGTDTITLAIYSDGAGMPGNIAITNGTATAVDISDTLTTSYAWVTFTFTTNPTLTAGTQYHLVLTGAYTISDTAYVSWGVDNYDVVYANGGMCVNDGTTWTTDSLYDACFEVYITGGATGNDGVALWDFSSKNMLLGVFGTSIYKMDKGSTGTPDGTWDTIPGGSSWDTSTKVMLHFDGSDAATTFTDEIGNVWTAGDNAQLDTAQKKFGSASLLLDGNGDYITTPDSSNWDLDSGSWTIDLQGRFSALPSASSYMAFAAQWVSTSGDDRAWGVGIYNDGGTYKLVLVYSVDGINSTFVYSSAVTVATGTFYHIEVNRDGDTLRFFLDGVAAGTGDLTGVTFRDSAGLLYIGRLGEVTTWDYNGWIDEFRFSKGIARHTADFTPPAAAYSATALPLTSSRFWTFADWQSGRALINTDVGLYTYTGSGNLATVAAAPIGKFIVVWKNYVFMAGIRGSPNQVRYCDLTDYTTWTVTNALNQFDTNDGDVITGIRILKGKLYVFKRYSVHRISYLGSNPTFQVDQILGMGCPSHYTIKEVDMGGELGSVLIFLTTDKKLAVFDGYNIQVINDNLTEESNDLFASADDQPLSFADMNYNYIDLFHAAVKNDTFEYILYCVLGSDTSVNYAFVLDYRVGGIFPYDGQIFSSSCYTISTNKSKVLYAAGYTGYAWQLESGNSDDSSAINAYWVSGKIKPSLVSLQTKLLQLGVHFKEVTSASTLNLSFKYRLDWNVSWTTAENTNYDHNDELAFGKTAIFDIGTIENMFQFKLYNNSTNPAPTIYGMDLYGVPIGLGVEGRATS